MKIRKMTSRIKKNAKIVCHLQEKVLYTRCKVPFFYKITAKQEALKRSLSMGESILKKLIHE